jgi:hypothetical protein
MGGLDIPNKIVYTSESFVTYLQASKRKPSTVEARESVRRWVARQSSMNTSRLTVEAQELV